MSLPPKNRSFFDNQLLAGYEFLCLKLPQTAFENSNSIKRIFNISKILTDNFRLYVVKYYQLIKVKSPIMTRAPMLDIQFSKF